MAASGKALDSGFYNDQVANLNTTLDKRVAVSKAQTFTAGEKTQARANMGAQAQAAALDAITSGATSANAGKVPVVQSDGSIAYATPASGGAVIDGTAPTAITN